MLNPWFSDDGRLRAGWRFLLGAAIAFVSNFVAIGIAESAARERARLLDAIYRPTTLVLLLAGFALLLIAADQVHEGLLRSMGLGRFPGWLRQGGLGMAIGAGLVCAAVLGIAVAGSADMTINLNGRTLELGLLELFILATGAMAEELMFRGYPFHRLLEAAPPAVAVVIMSVLFALAHGANPHTSKLAMFNTFAIAVLLCVAYLRTRALWLPWGIHFAWNTTLGLVFGLPVSGLTDFAVIVKTQARGPRWVTGGGYGIEGSVVGAIVVLLGFIPVVLLTRGKSPPVLAKPGRDEDGASPLQAEATTVAHSGDWNEPAPPDRPPAHRIQG